MEDKKGFRILFVQSRGFHVLTRVMSSILICVQVRYQTRQIINVDYYR